jgi:O-antigen/teichoic acid export membrane protein
MGRLLSAVAGLAGNAILARLLPPDEVGIYFLAVAVVTFGAVLGHLGLDRAVVRFVSQSVARNQAGGATRVVKLVLAAGALGGLIVGGGFAVGPGQWIARSLFDSPLMAEAVFLIGLWIVVMTIGVLVAETFRGLQDIRLATVFRELSPRVSQALLFALLWGLRGTSGLRTVLFLAVAAHAATVAAGVVLLVRRLPAPHVGTGPSARELYSTAWPLWISNLTTVVLLQADTAILGAARSHQEVALYGAATRVAGVLLIPLSILSAVILPIIAELHAKRRGSDLQNMARTTATVAVLPAALGLTAFGFLGDEILGVVYGPFYRESALVLLVLAAGLTVNVALGPCGLTLMMTGYQRAMMVISIFSAVATVSAAIVLANTFGAIGVAGAAAGGQILQSILEWVSAKRLVGVWTHAAPSIAPVRQLWSAYGEWRANRQARV